MAGQMVKRGRDRGHDRPDETELNRVDVLRLRLGATGPCVLHLLQKELLVRLHAAERLQVLRCMGVVVVLAHLECWHSEGIDAVDLLQ